VEPNPVSAQADIHYELKQADCVTCAIFDATGNLVAGLTAGDQRAGSHTLHWNATRVLPGIYFCKFLTAHETSTARLLVVR
jgi:flagellar hook assembly protein FlgD